MQQIHIHVLIHRAMVRNCVGWCVECKAFTTTTHDYHSVIKCEHCAKTAVYSAQKVCNSKHYRLDV